MKRRRRRKQIQKKSTSKRIIFTLIKVFLFVVFIEIIYSYSGSLKTTILLGGLLIFIVAVANLGSKIKKADSSRYASGDGYFG